jgi:hypothetical protein
MQRFNRYSFLAYSLTALCLIPLTSAQAANTPSPCPYSWTRNLQVGSTGNDVLKLQQFLNADPSTEIATSGIGSLGNETTNYGGRTKQAVAAFQEKYAADVLTPIGLTTGTGAVGTLTRSKLNALCAAQATTTAVQTSPADTDTLTVTSSVQPAATLAPAGAGGVPFTSVTLTAGSTDVTVSSITVERVGPGEDGAFADVTLADQNGTAIGTTEYFNAEHQATFPGPYIVPAGTTVTFTVSGDMASDETNFAGEMPALEVENIRASAPVVGTLPIRGTAQTINDTLQIGSASAGLSPYDPDSATTHYIDDTRVRFSGIRLTASPIEDLTLSSITWDQTGTAGSSDISNIATVMNGVAYPATTSDGHSYTSTFSPGVVIPKGGTIDLFVQGDLTTTGANHTVEFDIDSSSDIGLTGNTYGFGVSVAPTDDTAQSGNSVFLTSDGTTAGSQGASFYAGSVTTISPGALISVGNAQ